MLFRGWYIVEARTERGSGDRRPTGVGVSRCCRRCRGREGLRAQFPRQNRQWLNHDVTETVTLSHTRTT